MSGRNQSLLLEQLAARVSEAAARLARPAALGERRWVTAAGDYVVEVRLDGERRYLLFARDLVEAAGPDPASPIPDLRQRSDEAVRRLLETDERMVVLMPPSEQ